MGVQVEFSAVPKTLLNHYISSTSKGLMSQKYTIAIKILHNSFVLCWSHNNMHAIYLRDLYGWRIIEQRLTLILVKTTYCIKLLVKCLPEYCSLLFEVLQHLV